MKKIRCGRVGSDYLRVDSNRSIASITIFENGVSCSIVMTAGTIVKLRSQLKQALVNITRGETA